MHRKVNQNYVPDFLEDSPFLPLGSADDEFYDRRKAPQNGSILQLLRHRRTRRTLAITLMALVVLYFLRIIHRAAVRRWFSGPICLQSPPVSPAVSYADTANYDWSKYAYAQYVTSTDYLCNSLMIFETLRRLGSQASQLMLYPSTFDSLDENSIEIELLRKARIQYGVELVPIQVQRNDRSYYVWAESFNKLLTFNQTQYERILVLDSDSTVLQHMDELFSIPPCTAALPRAYWLGNPYLSSHIMLIQPSSREFQRIQRATKKASAGTYDMEIVNKLYGKDCVVLPHRKYALLTGEFRKKEHADYLGTVEEWDPEEIMLESKFVHFSDDPFPKPWLEPTPELVENTQPNCDLDSSGKLDCRERRIWLNLYEDFKERRQSVCGLELGERDRRISG